ncbi:MAG: WYL domain-containing protein [Clostridia bacterium]|nr:WYL domain-containing protein [Clostridia bacterium]
MAGNANAKMKLLVLADIFRRYSDEDHILNSADIIDYLQESGIDAERKSLYSDIAILREYGMDIISATTPKKGYFLGSRDFELAEVRLLSDAVQAADFISPSKTRALVTKIGGFASEHQEKKLKEQIYIDARQKCSNEEIYYSIDALDTAIKVGKRVRLQYAKRVMGEKFTARKESRSFELSPYALIWSNDHYYLIANNGKYDNLSHWRIDRIHSVEVLQENTRPIHEVCEYRATFNTADYVGKKFNMFTGTTDVVELDCDSEILEQILDRFGENVNLRKGSAPERFSVRFTATVSDGLVSYIMQFGEHARVVFPEELRDMVKEKARRICEAYAHAENGE